MVMQNGYDIIVILRFGNKLNTKQEDAMSKIVEWNSKDNLDSSLKSATIIIVSCVVMYIVLMAIFTGVAKSEDNLEKLRQLQTASKIDYIKIGWPSSLIYDITGVCAQATYRWIVQSNPALIGRIPPPPAQRLMLEHCFCLLDRLRNQYNLEEYFKMVAQPKVFGEVRTQIAIRCIKHDGTLLGMVTLNESTDNEPTIDNSTVIPEKQEDSEESLPDQPKEESPNEDTKPIFQG